MFWKIIGTMIAMVLDAVAAIVIVAIPVAALVFLGLLSKPTGMVILAAAAILAAVAVLIRAGGYK